ncbi:FAD-dependent monooxygenase [Nocardia aurantia]|uniref:5-methylphenazine-1-carboxylate 1-monooxygenase n=1 Tax=Nocardia aurantia TaxID=2585199 RepID=A0A7K0DMY4_9NOCA|nr:FAD-dependent monooxygenase [Nocardia aurantia]MQY26702.1 5-methylphenazine-1-carboxylate 1-monooxygenase [Nocardia aurantia]
MTTSTIVIAGAGIGGLTAALALHARGHRVTVLEAAPEIRPLGVGINIQPAAVGELTGLGLGTALSDNGIATRAHRYVDHRGATLWSEPRGIDAGNPFPQYSIHRGELQMLLLRTVRDRLGPDAVRTGEPLRAFQPGPGSVRVHAGDAVHEADVLVGADGLHSAVRARLHPAGPPVVHSDVGMWRGVTELPGFLDGRTMIIGSDEQGNRLIAYPCSRPHAERGRALLNWVCLAAGPAGRTDGDPLAEVLPRFAHWDLGWLDLTAVLTHCREILRYPMADREPLESWGYGRVTLLGDAAHPMYPIGANGASQAIVDAIVLADELTRDEDLVTGLRRYESIRIPATTAIVRANRSMDRKERAVAGRPEAEVSSRLAAITRDYRTTVESLVGSRVGGHVRAQQEEHEQR